MTNTDTMEEVVTELAQAVGSAQLWSIFANAVPYIAIAVLFALGYRIIKKALKGTSKGKVSM